MQIFLTQLNFIPTHHNRMLDLVIGMYQTVFVYMRCSVQKNQICSDHGTVSFEFHAYTKVTHKIKRTVLIIVMETLNFSIPTKRIKGKNTLLLQKKEAACSS